MKTERSKTTHDSILSCFFRWGNVAVSLGARRNRNDVALGLRQLIGQVSNKYVSRRVAY